LPHQRSKLINKMEITNTKNRAKLSAIVNYNGFADAFGNLPNRHSSIVRRELLKRLKCCPRTFFSKKIGEAPIRENEVPIIEEIFSRFGLNAWNGERI